MDSWHLFHILGYNSMLLYFSSVQFSRSVVSDSLRPHESQHARPPCPSPTPGVHWDSHPSSQWCHPAISSSVIPFSSCPQIPPSIRVFSNESTLRMRWPKYWSFSFSIIPSKEISGLIFFRMDWLNLFAVQGTLKSLLQQPQFIIFVQIVPALAIGSSFSWLLYLFDIPLSLCFAIFLPSKSWSSYVLSLEELTLYMSCSSPRISHFYKESQFFLL